MRIQPSLRIGNNRTGLAVAPDRNGMLDIPREITPTSRGSADQIASVRTRYAREGGPTGTMPREPHLEKEMLPLVDLLGARMAYERTGVRLYDALIAKHDAFGGFAGGPERRDLAEIRDEELRHMRMLDSILSDIGADSTAVTPCANRELVMSRGAADIMLDPRTSLLDGLETIVVVELADREQWIGLVDIAREMNRDDLIRAFTDAQRVEEEHLTKVRAWISAARSAVREQVGRGGNGRRART